MDIEVTLDCCDLAGTTRFWEQALGRRGEVSVPDAFVSLEPPGDRGLVITLQHVDEPKTTKNRMHLDLLVDDVDTEVARLETLGARRLTATASEHYGQRWFVMADPEGNEFCVARQPG